MALTSSERRLVDEASAWFDAHRDRFVDELCELLRFPSVADESDPNPKPGAPYGHEVRRVFDHMLAKAVDDGFIVRDYDGHVMEVGYPQAAVPIDDDIAFVGHLDVVPAGEGWTHDAFEPRVVNNDIVIGRGALDNKGVSLVNYFLLRFFKDREQAFRHRVRMLYGGSEEIALNDIKWFVAHVGAPHQAIVTDGPFPVNNIQKGLLDVDVAIPVGRRLRGWHAGASANTIPGEASIVLDGVDAELVRRALDAAGGFDADAAGCVRVAETEAGALIVAEGISGHASQPDGTVNAIGLLADALDRFGLLADDAKDAAAARAIAQWVSDPYGSGVGVTFDNTESGPTTINGGTIRPQNDAIVLHFDIRYAVGQTEREIVDRLRAHAQAVGGRILDVLNDDPYYVPADDPRIELLTATYDDVLDCAARPVSMGGGTHARFIPRALNFGPEFHAQYVPAADGITLDAPSCIAPGTGSAHGVDEWVSIGNLKAAFVMYALGLVRLDRYLDGNRSDQPN